MSNNTLIVAGIAGAALLLMNRRAGASPVPNNFPQIAAVTVQTSPLTVLIGETAQAVVRVDNIGGAKGNYDIVAQIGGNSISTTVQVQPGQTMERTLRIPALPVGVYSLVVSVSIREIQGEPGSTASRTVPNFLTVEEAVVPSPSPSPTPVTQKPAPPTSLTATLVTNAGAPAVRLEWNASPGATSYRIYRNGVMYMNIPNAVPGFLGVTNGMLAGTGYSFAVRAVNTAGESGDSNTASVTMPGTPPNLTQVPGVPTLTARLVSGKIVVFPKRAATGGDPTQFDVDWRGSDGSTGGVAMRWDVTSHTFDSANKAGVTYTLTAYAKNSAGASGKTSPINVTIPVSGSTAAPTVTTPPVTTPPITAPPSTPTGFGMSHLGSGVVRFNWNPVAGATSYSINVYYSDGRQRVGIGTGGSAYSYTLGSGTWIARIRANSPYGYSFWSSATVVVP